MYRIFVFNSIAIIIVPCVERVKVKNTVTVFLSLDIHAYCIGYLFSIVLLLLFIVKSSVHYINFEFENIAFLIKGSDSFMVFHTAASGCKIDPMLKTGYIIQ